MDSALQDIQDFISKTMPLRYLTAAQLNQLTPKIKIIYLRKGTMHSAKSHQLLIIRKGVVNQIDAEHHLIETLAERDLFNHPLDSQTNSQLVAEQDSLIYLLEYDEVKDLLATNERVLSYFEQNFEYRITQGVAEINDRAMVSASLSNRLVEDCFNAPVATIKAGQSIHEAATLMTLKGFSCLVVMENSNPVGIITDKDIRRRCVAVKLSYDTAVEEIMTSDVKTIDRKTTAYDALMLMTSQQIHHLPVTENDVVIGMLTATDLMTNEGNNTVTITGLIHKADSVAALAKIARLLPQLQIRMTLLGTRASHVVKSISAINVALTHRLAKLAHQTLGDAPVPYVWVSLGSLARREQLIHTDQDHALIIADEMLNEHDPWFEQFAQFIADGLKQCGIDYCPGDVMATNPKWRQPVAVWKAYFNQWIQVTDPMALMHSSIFFDMEPLVGDPNLAHEVRESMLTQTRNNTIFLAHMTQNALHNRPPLGFIRDFVLISEGEHKSTLDIKHSGIAPLVDLARIYALAEGQSAVSTLDRLRAVRGSATISEESANSMMDAYRLLMQIRLEHQTRKLQSHQAPDNYLSLSELSSLERQHLKDAFKLIKRLQDSRQSLL